jgi:periplasmic divalent cation tolerance protein
MPDTPVLLLFTTFPGIDQARSAVRTLVEERLAACGNIVPGLESIYSWKGNIETSQETLVLLKTRASLYEAAEARLRQLHPYEVPEIIAVPVTAGSQPYLDWVRQSCAPE